MYVCVCDKSCGLCVQFVEKQRRCTQPVSGLDPAYKSQ